MYSLWLIYTNEFTDYIQRKHHHLFGKWKVGTKEMEGEKIEKVKTLMKYEMKAKMSKVKSGS